MSLPQIAEGWRFFIEKDIHTQQLMLFRLNICNSCEFKVELNPIGKAVITTIDSTASIYKCAKCSCPLATKTASPSSACPMKKWGIAGTEAMY